MIKNYIIFINYLRINYPYYFEKINDGRVKIKASPNSLNPLYIDITHTFKDAEYNEFEKIILEYAKLEFDSAI